MKKLLVSDQGIRNQVTGIQESKRPELKDERLPGAPISVLFMGAPDGAPHNGGSLPFLDCVHGEIVASNGGF